jgi:hypothetical protein
MIEEVEWIANELHVDSNRMRDPEVAVADAGTRLDVTANLRQTCTST